MPNVIQILRNSTAGTRPAAKQAGEPWVNHADKQFGVHDGTAANDLLAVRYFAATATYAVGDHAIESGTLYKCVTAVTVPGVFAPANWAAIGAGGLDQATGDTLYVNVAGDTMGGALLLFQDPVVDMEAATMGYVLDQVALRLPLTAGPTASLTGQLHLPAALPTLDAEATSKLYVDQADAVLQTQVDTLASNLLFVGTLNAATDVADFSTASGLTDGAMPAAAVANTGFYVIVNTGGTPPAGELPAEAFALGDWAVSDGTAWIRLPIGQSQMTGDSIAITPPASQPTWTDVQIAINGLETNKVDIAGDTMTGALVMAGPPTLPLHPVTLAYLQSATLDAGTY